MAKQELLIWGVRHQADDFPIVRAQLDKMDLKGKRIGVELPDDFVQKYKIPMHGDEVERSLRRSILVYAGYAPEKVGAMDRETLRNAFKDQDMKAAYGARKFWYDILQYLRSKGAAIVAMEDPELLRRIKEYKLNILKAERRKDDIEVSATRLEEEHLTHIERVDAMAAKIKQKRLDLMLVGNIHLGYLYRKAMQLPRVKVMKKDLCPPKSREEAEQLERYAREIEGIRQFYAKLALRKRKVARLRAKLGPKPLGGGNVVLLRNERQRRMHKPKT